MVHEIEVLSSLMRQTYTTDISMFNEEFLLRTLEHRQTITKMKDFLVYRAYLDQNPAEAEALTKDLLNNFSRFFRETLSFAILEHQVLPSIIQDLSGNAEIRIWSAGCSYGQEVYSIAILLNELAQESGKTFRYRIFATDICPEAIASARLGIFDSNNLQNIRLKHLETYFTKVGNNYAVSAQLKQQIYFSVYDLLDPETNHPPESIFGDFDLVICSNLLIYYRSDLQRVILAKLQQSLATRGYLMCGGAERMLVDTHTKLEPVKTSAAIFRNTKRRNLP